jgi:hypothetical protein
MATIQTVKQWSEVAPHLTGLRDTIERDFRPMLKMDDKQKGAPFSVCREVTAYIDHLGHLYTGSSKVEQRFKAYMDKVLGGVDANYRQRAGEVYQMYRCGTVHEFEPKVLENRKGQLLVWLCYQGARTDAKINPVGIGDMTVTHLVPVLQPNGKAYALPVSTNCLLDDLEASINCFIAAGPEDERVTAWNRAARELTRYEPFDFTV